MRAARIIVLLFVLLPLGSCSYFWFIGYPEVAQRESHGPYSVVALVAPTWFLSPELMFGSVHNNTSIDVFLVRGDEELAGSTLVSGEDLPIDHLPLKVLWSDDAVTITEHKGGKSVTFKMPGNGIRTKGTHKGDGGN